MTASEEVANQPEITRRAYLYFVLTIVLGILMARVVCPLALKTGAWHRGLQPRASVKGLIHDLSLSPAKEGQLKGIIEESRKQRREWR